MNKYNEVIKELQQFEGNNNNYNEILEECNNDIEEATYILRLVLNRLIDDCYDDEMENKKFYTEMLNKLD